MPKGMTQSDPSCVSMKVPISLSARRAGRSRPSRASRNAMIAKYLRNGTVNLFVFLDTHRPWRRVKVRPNSAPRGTLPHACAILSISITLRPMSSGSFWTISRPILRARSMKPFRRREAHRILRRLEFHFTPKHASWLDMVEIEIGVLRSQCIDRRIDQKDRLVAEIAAWQDQRNLSGARIKWMFTTERARSKLARAYPTPVEES